VNQAREALFHDNTAQLNVQLAAGKGVLSKLARQRSGEFHRFDPTSEAIICAIEQT
jgi:hypothetical protein